MLVWLYVSMKRTMEFYFWLFENIKLDTVLNKPKHTYPSNMIKCFRLNVFQKTNIFYFVPVVTETPTLLCGQNDEKM